MDPLDPTDPLPHASFYERDGDCFLPTPLCRGPWRSDAQHGGPPAALLAAALEEAGGGRHGAFVARLSFGLLRPVPLSPLRLQLDPPRGGRTVQRQRAWLEQGGEVVLEAEALRIRREPQALPPPPPTAPWPDPEGLPRLRFGFFQDPVAYHRAIDLRLVSGLWGATPIALWARIRVPLVAGLPTSPLAALVCLADAQSGMGVPLDPLTHSFVNPDLNVLLERDPEPGWVGFDIRSVAGPQGSGLSQSALRDHRGELGRSAQCLVVSPR